MTLYHNQIRLRSGRRFPVEMPNPTTRKVFEATDYGEELKSYRDLDEMFEALDRILNLE